MEDKIKELLNELLDKRFTVLDVTIAPYRDSLTHGDYTLVLKDLKEDEICTITSFCHDVRYIKGYIDALNIKYINEALEELQSFVRFEVLYKETS